MSGSSNLEILLKNKKKVTMILILSPLLFLAFVTPIWYLFGITQLTPLEVFLGLITVVPLYSLLALYLIFEGTSRIE